MERALVGLSGAHGLCAVALGAFGAHGLRGVLAGLEDAAERADWWQTAAHYQLAHALAIGLAAWATTRGEGRAAPAAGLCFAAGAALFSGTLYAMALGAPRWLGAVKPLGGALLIAG